MSKFVLDTNIFIEAYRRYYSFDIAPAFWKEIIQKAEAGLLVSIDRVYDELNNSDDGDQLRIWANNEFGKWFISTNNETVFAAYREVIGWAVSQTQFVDAAKTEFASIADSWLIACAKAHDFTIITHEQFDPYIKRKIPIPNVCRELGIQCINTFEMLRRLGIRFN